jgi:ribonuclease HII
MLICGFDEVGRGPLAGPVVASAVLLSADHGIAGLADSKAISEKRREALAPIIMSACEGWGLGWVWPAEIDQINIHRSSLLAMRRAFDDMLENLGQRGAQLSFSLRVDGKFLPDFSASRRYDPGLHGDVAAEIRGDSLIDAISAASIVAKVTRDRWMTDHARKEPMYGFERHKGYPTKAHREAIRTYGPSSIQRMSFRY